MKHLFSLLAILSLASFTFSQEFSFQMYFEDAAGAKDTLTLGYDALATNGIDTAFGEVNIIAQTLDATLDVRISDEWYNREYLGQSGTYHTKTQIQEKNCGAQFSLMDIGISTDNWPVTATWDSTLFTTNCLNGTLFTSINPGGWWDTGSPSNLYRAILLNQSQATFTSNSEGGFSTYYGYITDNNDSVPAFWFAFGDSTLPMLDIGEESPQVEIAIYPNPSTGKVRVELLTAGQEIQSISILDLKGRKLIIEHKNTSIDMTRFVPGMYFIEISLANGQQSIHKIIKQ